MSHCTAWSSGRATKSCLCFERDRDREREGEGERGRGGSRVGRTIRSEKRASGQLISMLYKLEHQTALCQLGTGLYCYWPACPLYVCLSVAVCVRVCSNLACLLLQLSEEFNAIALATLLQLQLHLDSDSVCDSQLDSESALCSCICGVARSALLRFACSHCVHILLIKLISICFNAIAIMRPLYC